MTAQMLQMLKAAQIDQHLESKARLTSAFSAVEEAREREIQIGIAEMRNLRRNDK